MVNRKVGIVIVSYNAAKAVALTLASLRLARNSVPYELILVDNASEESERRDIREAFDRYSADAGDTWRYIQQQANLGFSGGNNVGIRVFLEEGLVSDICLLNSDVVVTDHWLDRMVAADKDLVSTVTNKADGEQCVPVDYDCSLDEFGSIAGPGEDQPEAYERIVSFAERWHSAWRGNLVEGDATFFCVLIKRRVFDAIGCLDEHFFPGGFEDDDFCMRAQEAGFRVHLARDAFIHHWGSASFGKLQYEYFSERAKRNREYLEQKHGITWRMRPEKPFASFRADVAFALETGRSPEQAAFLELYVDNLTRLLEHYEREFAYLSSELRSRAGVIPGDVAGLMQLVEALDLRAAWRDAVAAVRDAGPRASPELQASIERALDAIVTGVFDKVRCNFDMHAVLTAIPGAEPAPISLPSVGSVEAMPPAGRIARLAWNFWRALRWLLVFDGMVFFGGYFYPERESDGYFQRIRIVDRLFTKRWRVYVESDELPGRGAWFDRPAEKVVVLRVTGSRKRKWLTRMLVAVAVLRSRKIYYHSVLRMRDNRFGAFLRIPGLRKAVDIHGVVPEEFRLHDDHYSARLYDTEERIAVRKAGLIVVVTEAMHRYLRQKYRDELAANVVAFPMFPDIPPTAGPRPYVDGLPVVVYAGGLHKWQQVPKMLEAMERTIDLCRHRFYCPQPDEVRKMLPPALVGRIEVDAKTHAELADLYRQCHYGMVLRADIVVNRVACPTKLVEYLAMGIVPIVESDDIGDFKALGMQCLGLEDFRAGRLPDEPARLAMAQSNQRVYEKLQETRQLGSILIHDFFFDPGARERRPSGWLRRALPAESRRGRAARRVSRALFESGHRHGASEPRVGHVPVPVPQREKCDVLVQVESFEAGGLENVVLDLNDVLSRAGYEVALLVQGISGKAVERAAASGMQVIVQPHGEHAYRAMLERLRPRIVIAHYSTDGAAICRQMGIPFVQVIHNVYMWFNDDQRRDFANAAADTSLFVAVSDTVKEYSVARLGVPESACRVITNGIDFAPFERLDNAEARRRLRSELGFGEEDFIFLGVGAVNHQKNHMGLVRAFFAASREMDATTRLVIIGPVYEPALLDELRSYIAEHGLGDRVVYRGPAERPHEYLAMADAFASAAHFEGCQLTLLEAIRGGLPVVTTRVGLAGLFEGRDGFAIVEPPVDLMRYRGAIWELASTAEFEARLATAMIEARAKRIVPDVTAEELAALDKEHAYAAYLDLVREAGA